jgi:hypothetical protein
MRKLHLTLPFLITCLCGNAQIKKLSSFIESRAGYTAGNTVPFWMRSNQYGSVPLHGGSAGFIGGTRIDFDSSRKHLIDWGASFEVRVNLAYNSQFLLTEGYGKLRVGVFELKGGRTEDMIGLTDTTFMSGAHCMSGNPLGIPKVQIALLEYKSLF